MRRQDAFTLVEMLAVASIMLILLGVSYGIFASLTQQSGPESVLVTLQAAIHNARDYAAANGVSTRVLFRCEDHKGDPLESSIMVLQHLPPEADDFEDIPGRQPIPLPHGLYVCNGFPSGSPPSRPSVASDGDVSDTQARQWEKYEQDLLAWVGRAFLSGVKLKSNQDKFCIEFGPAGYPPAEPQSSEDIVDQGLTVIQVAGERVLGYAFYTMNPNTGTRLVFE